MKAEHRKELETNALAEGLSKSAEALKANSKLIYQVLGVGLLVAGVVAVAWYYLGGVSSAQSNLWAQFDAAPDVDALEKMAAANHGTVPARSAQYEAARILLQDGFTNFGTSGKPHDDAVEKIVKGRDIYKKLLNDSKSSPLLYQEALMGAARAEEMLSATLQPNQAQTYGSLDQAADYYRQVAKEFPSSFQGKAAADRLKIFDDPKQREDLRTFYADLNNRLTPRATPSGSTPPKS